MNKRRRHHRDILPVGLQRGVKPEQILSKIHSVEGKSAELVSNWAGSMTFFYVHIVWFSTWIIINSTAFFDGIIEPFDPFPFAFLTLIVSLEAIFLATFIMINQNRQALVDTYRDLEEEIEDLEEEKEQEELEEEVEDIQKDLDEIKDAILTISSKIENIEKTPSSKPKSKKQ